MDNFLKLIIGLFYILCIHRQDADMFSWKILNDIQYPIFFQYFWTQTLVVYWHFCFLLSWTGSHCHGIHVGWIIVADPLHKEDFPLVPQLETEKSNHIRLNIYQKASKNRVGMSWYVLVKVISLGVFQDHRILLIAIFWVYIGHRSLNCVLGQGITIETPLTFNTFIGWRKLNPAVDQKISGKPKPRFDRKSVMAKQIAEGLSFLHDQNVVPQTVSDSKK